MRWRLICLAQGTRGLTEREIKALREIADLLIPDSFNVFGYSKATVIEGILESIREDQIVGLRMRMIYKALKRCYEG